MPKESTSFATFNLKNLNLPNQPIYGGDGLSQNQYDEKVEWTSSVVSELEPDVWGFQELWAVKALRDVFDASGLSEKYELLVPEGHSGEKIVCAGAMKKDYLQGETEWIEQFPEELEVRSEGDDPQTSPMAVDMETFSRPVLHFQGKFREDTEPVHFFVAHLKSKNPTDVYDEEWYNEEDHSDHSGNLGYTISTIRRTVEASALRMILTSLMKDSTKPVVVLGDLNDGQRSNTLNILTEQPRYLVPGFYPGGGDTALYSVQRLKNYRTIRDVYYTHEYKKVKESLDHILVSEEFYDYSDDRVWAFDDAGLVNDHLNKLVDDAGAPSDHGIVKASFAYRPSG